MRGAKSLTADQLAAANSTNAILPSGHVNGLNLAAGESMLIRNYQGNIAITIDDSMTMAAGSVLNILLDDEAWGSTISLADGLTPDLAGTLQLGFAPGIDLQEQIGRTFTLFNWNGQLPPTCRFDEIVTPGCRWDLGNLYTTGQATLINVPEPATLSLLALGGLLTVRRRRSASSSTRWPGWTPMPSTTRAWGRTQMAAG